MTVTQLQPLLSKYVGPADSVTDATFLIALNQVRQRFFDSGKWKGLVIEAELTPADGVVGLPDNCEAALSAQIDGRPAVIFSRQHEVTAGGGGAVGLIDNGDRTYKIMGKQDVGSVKLTCKMRYQDLEPVPDEPAEDYVEPQVYPDNVGALKLGLLSLAYEDNADLERADMYFVKALQLLNGEVKEARGGAQFTMQMSPHGFHMGGRNIRNLY
jgi:hypothetical protein